MKTHNEERNAAKNSDTDLSYQLSSIILNYHSGTPFLPPIPAVDLAQNESLMIKSAESASLKTNLFESIFSKHQK